MQEKVGDHFWRDMPIVTGVRGHDVTQDMDPNTNRLSLSSVKVKAVQHKAQERLSVIRSDTRGPLSRQGIPLKQIAFRFKMLPFGITTRWPYHRNLSVPGFEHLFDFLKIPQGLSRPMHSRFMQLFGEPLKNSSSVVRSGYPSRNLHLAKHFFSEERKAGTPVHQPFVRFYFVHSPLY